MNKDILIEEVNNYLNKYDCKKILFSIKYL